MSTNTGVESAPRAGDATSGGKGLLGRLSGERLAIYLLCFFLGAWLLSIVSMQGYLIVKHGVGSGLDGGRHVPAEIAQKYGTDKVEEIMKATNKAVADRPRGETSTLAEDLVVYARAAVILFALTAFWYIVVSRITPFPVPKGSVGSSTASAELSKAPVLSEYPRLQRFTLICDVILFSWIIVEGAFIIPFMMIRYGLHY